MLGCFSLAVDHRGSESVSDNDLDSALLATSVEVCTVVEMEIPNETFVPFNV